MPNALKPFGEKDTELLSGRFHQARMRLTLIYVVILAVILFSSSGSIYSMFSNRLDHRFARLPRRLELILPPGFLAPSPAEVRTDLVNSLTIVNGFLLLLAGVLSYWLAGITLQPIQAAYNRQRRFLSDASHELRTPLAILHADLENDLVDPAGTELSRQRAKSHLEEVKRMSLLVGDLLTLSRLDEHGERGPLFIRLDLTDVLSDVVHRLQSVATHHRVALAFAVVEEHVFVVANKELLIQALGNVIKNAILYNKENGSVAVSLKTEDGRAVVRVADTGIGIAQDDLARIFERFYRTDESRSRRTGGSGLGLAIAQSVLKQFNGSIALESVLGVGTTVTISLPLVKAS